MRLCFSLLAALALLASDAQAQTSRLFLVPTARPVQRVEVGARWIVPSVEANLGRGVSVGMSGLALPVDDDLNALGLADVRWTFANRERWALAVGVNAAAEYSSGHDSGHVPFSMHPYVVGTVGGASSSASAGVGVSVTGRDEYRFPDSGCPQCGFLSVSPEYRVGVRSLPYLFGGVEAEMGRVEASAYSFVAEALAAPTGDNHYNTLAMGGMRVTHKRVTVDLGGAFSTEVWDGQRQTDAAPWVALSVGF